MVNKEIAYIQSGRRRKQSVSLFLQSAPPIEIIKKLADEEYEGLDKNENYIYPGVSIFSLVTSLNFEDSKKFHLLNMCFTRYSNDNLFETSTQADHYRKAFINKIESLAFAIDSVDILHELVKVFPDSSTAKKAITRIEVLTYEAAESIEALNEYIESYPKGEFTTKAEETIQALVFAQAETIEEIEELINSYPTRGFVPTAKQRVEKMYFDAAQTVDDFELYIKNYESGQYVEQAKSSIEQLELNEANTEEKLRRFLDKYKNGQFVADATSKLEHLLFRQADTIPELEAFVHEFGQSGYLTREAKIKIEALEEIERNKPIKTIFIYAYQDHESVKELRKYMYNRLIRSQKLSIFDIHVDTQIGANGNNQWLEKLKESSMVFLFISSDLFVSEVAELANRVEGYLDDKTVIPIIVRHTDLNGTKFEGLASLPRGAAAIGQEFGSDQWTKLAGDISEIVNSA